MAADTGGVLGQGTVTGEGEQKSLVKSIYLPTYLVTSAL
jgi:hypothetical protein